MTPAEAKLLGRHVAREIFKVGSDRGRVVQRLQFMLGRYPNDEQPGGGLCEGALADVVASALLTEALRP